MFGWYRSEKPPVPAVARLENDFIALRSDVDALRSANKRLELEWTETYDKVRHQLSRMARRKDLPPSIGDGENAPLNANGEPEMDPVSAAIHARRSRGFLGRSE